MNTIEFEFRYVGGRNTCWNELSSNHVEGRKLTMRLDAINVNDHEHTLGNSSISIVLIKFRIASLPRHRRPYRR